MAASRTLIDALHSQQQPLPASADSLQAEGRTGCCRAKDLISKLLTVDPRRRPTASQALEHPWVVGTLHEPAQLTRTRENMRKHLRSRWKVGPHPCM